MNSKALKQLLANSIEAGIAQHQNTIAKNNAKEQNGLAKLSKTLGGADPALTGAGGNLSAGSATTEVPNLARAEFSAGKDGRYRRGEGLVGTVATRIRPEFKRVAAKKNNTRAEFEASKVEKGALMDSLTKPGLQGKAPSLMGKVKSGVSTGIVNAKQKLGIGRNEFGKGALPDVEKNMSDSGGAGARAAVKASGSPINKDEMDAGNNCPMCSGPAEPLGVLGNMLHLLCRNCGSHSTTIVEENTERKENAGPTVSKGEPTVYLSYKKLIPGEKVKSGDEVLVYGNRTSKRGWEKVVPGTAGNRVHSGEKGSFRRLGQVEKSEPLATMRTTKAKGISGLPAPKSKMVVKGEFKTPSQAEYPKAEGKYQANDEISDAPHTNWSKVNSSLVGKKIPSVNKGIRRIAKEEISPMKEVPMTRLVTDEKVNGAKGIGDEKVPAAIKTDGSGDITKGKSLEKGSLPMIPGKGVANKNKYLGYLSSLKFSPNTAYANQTGAKTVQTLNSPEPQVLHPSDKIVKAEASSNSAYHQERAKAQSKANETGFDYGVEKNAFGYSHFMLPQAKNRAGHERSAEVVSCENLKNCKPGHGPMAKGALVDHIKASSAKAGVNVKDVLGYKPPKTLQVAKPAPTPNFNKSNIPMTGFAREAAIKTGKPVIPGRPMVTKLTGGVQGQIAAQKKPLIPMVNNGVVAKGETSNYYKDDKAAKEAIKKLPPTKVTKAESPAAKPIAKSPSSGPAGKVSAPKPTSNLAPRAPKL